MRAFAERIFDPAQPMIVRRPLTAAGRHFKPGDEFDWKRMAVDQRRVRLLFEQGKLRHSSEPVRQSKPATPRPDPVKPEPQVQEPADELDNIEDMKVLREIAIREGARTTVAKDRQRELIRDNRKGM